MGTVTEGNSFVFLGSCLEHSRLFHFELETCSSRHAKPSDYESSFFRGCIEDETHNTWTTNHLKMEVENVNNKHFVLALKVKSVFDSCEDDNVRLAIDSMQEDGNSDVDSKVKCRLYSLRVEKWGGRKRIQLSNFNSAKLGPYDSDSF